ncbi:MAG TPA: F0F1 ATP synthase subunit delta [Candidatus Ligilactobacillus excrementigallinarum]|uniref:ATP synthase subunit delta n=1 Tax=Candidatus Ligilactobacillus excrementigallinarum TaxID=2838641 RepID=A0A9D1UVZ6_9LACO|nr:F0F1 ATP synthase subunit delta [Candidatus Ligilactobacillus excrementigallinarum]
MAIDNATIARRYGNALFEVAKEQDSLAETATELNEIKAALEKEPGFVVFMTSPQIDEKVKKDTLESMAKGASSLVANLLHMLFDYHRIANLESIIGEFNRLYDADRKIVRATVRTAIALEDDQKQKLAATFAKIENANQVILDEKVDPSIIGGVVLQSESHIYDGSIRSKFEQIKRLLLK